MKILLALLSLTLFACGGSADKGTGQGDDAGDDPPPECYEEKEPNGVPDSANWAGALPALEPAKICGHVYSEFGGGQNFDDDWYWFPMDPNPGIDVIYLNIELDNDPVVQYSLIRLYQTTYDEDGKPVGLHFLGTYYAYDGDLFVGDIPIRYDFLEANDLYIQVHSLFPSLDRYPYTLTYWGF